MLTIRVDLQRASPPIWRRLELRSDLTLAEVHQILQTAFDWYDYHLFRFALGGNPFDPHVQLFLCPYDAEEGEDDGTPVEQVRLDETLQQVGDRLEYLYDYGDSWHLKLKVEAVRRADEETPPARATGGRRAAPPEDCGSLTTAAELAEVLPDPALFDLDELNELLADYDPLPAVAVPDESVLRDVLRPVLWFLDRADDGGIPLTSAGYMSPAVVREASSVVPDARGWIGANNRESQTYPVLAFREMLQSLKLLRKYKGRLLPTRRATDLRNDLQGLWDGIAQVLVPDKAGFEREATIELLQSVASAPTATAASFGQLESVAATMTHRGWSQGDGPVTVAAVHDLVASTLLRNMSGVRSEQVSRVRCEQEQDPGPARLMAIAALQSVS